MRAGPLSSREVIELLNGRFANAWVLASDLERLRDEPGVGAEVRALAVDLLERYRYPVDTQVCRSDGTLRAQKAAHDLMSEEGVTSYLELLRSALE